MGKVIILETLAKFNEAVAYVREQFNLRPLTRTRVAKQEAVAACEFLQITSFVLTLFDPLFLLLFCKE